ncbi:hypothetical protein HK096_007783 [Nowakowskiella sp. JEL0078]|nr:hypothetical protein HK096_007783 [Nowakowskiella sp. JEL0078]
MVPKSERNKPSFVVNFFSGGLAGMAGAAVTCPLEVVKTRMQSSLYKHHIGNNLKSSHNTINPFRIVAYNVKGVVDTLSFIRRKEGIHAWWKGLGPNLVGVIPARSIYFAVYSQGKHFYTTLNDQKETSVVHMASAATAGIATSFCTNPIWLIKTRMQLQSDQPGLRKYKNSLDCSKQVMKNEGIRGFYKGLSASLLGLFESTFQFVLYEHLKKELLAFRRNNTHPLASSKNESTMNAFDSFVSAAAAKLTAAVATYPHEVLRTRLRQSPGPTGPKYTGLLQCTKLIVKEEGFAALYGGMTAHLLRTVPNAAIMFFTYELITGFISTWMSRKTLSDEEKRGIRV